METEMKAGLITSAEGDQASWQQNMTGMRWCLRGSQDTHSGSLYSAPLNLIAPGCSSPVWAHSPAWVTFLHWSHELKFQGAKRCFLASKFIAVFRSFEFSALSTLISVFIAKLKDSSICHAANPLQLLMVADVTGSDMTGWFPPWLGQLEQSSTEVNPFVGPLGSPRMGKGLGICKYTFYYLPLPRSTGKAKSIH